MWSAVCFPYTSRQKVSWQSRPRSLGDKPKSRGIEGRNPEFIHYTRRVSLRLWMSLHNPNQARHVLNGFSMTFWTLILQGLLVSPLHTFMYSYGLLQRRWSGPLTWDIRGSVSFPCALVGQRGYAVIHRDSQVYLCVYVVPKSPSLLTFSQWMLYD